MAAGLAGRMGALSLACSAKKLLREPMQAPKLDCTFISERSHFDTCRWVRSSCSGTGRSANQVPWTVLSGFLLKCHSDADVLTKALLLCSTSRLNHRALQPEVSCFLRSCGEEEASVPATQQETYPKALVCQDNGAVVMPVTDDSPHGLVNCPGGLLRVPLLPGQARGCRQLATFPAALA